MGALQYLCEEDLSCTATRRLQKTSWSSLNYLDETVLDDLKSHKLTLTEAVNMAQNYPVLRLLASRGAMHACGAFQK